jgi:hypothetical protein
MAVVRQRSYRRREPWEVGGSITHGLRRRSAAGGPGFFCELAPARYGMLNGADLIRQLLAGGGVRTSHQLQK